MSKKTLLAIVALAVIIGAVYYFNFYRVKVVPASKGATPAPQALGVAAKRPDDGPAFSYACVKGKTALELLTAKVNGQLEVKDSSLGKMVESIDNLKNGTDKRYWMYSINGSLASVGADSYKCNDTEVIEWRFSLGE